MILLARERERENLIYFLIFIDSVLLEYFEFLLPVPFQRLNFTLLQRFSKTLNYIGKNDKNSPGKVSLPSSLSRDESHNGAIYSLKF